MTRRPKQIKQVSNKTKSKNLLRPDYHKTSLSIPVVNTYIQEGLNLYQRYISPHPSTEPPVLRIAIITRHNSYLNIQYVYTINNFTEKENQDEKETHLPCIQIKESHPPLDISNINNPHIITKLFPIFKDLHQIIRLSQVSSLLLSIEQDLQCKLSIPLMAGVSVQTALADIIFSTLYISLLINQLPNKPIKQSKLINMNILSSLEQTIIAFSCTGQYPIIYNNNILSTHSIYDLNTETKQINDEAARKIAKKI